MIEQDNIELIVSWDTHTDVFTDNDGEWICSSPELPVTIHWGLW